jgi:hypothetical protein
VTRVELEGSPNAVTCPPEVAPVAPIRALAGLFGSTRLIPERIADRVSEFVRLLASLTGDLDPARHAGAANIHETEGDGGPGIGAEASHDVGIGSKEPGQLLRRVVVEQRIALKPGCRQRFTVLIGRNHVQLVPNPGGELTPHLIR